MLAIQDPIKETATTPVMETVAADSGPMSWMPPAASTFTDSVDGVWVLTFWLCVFFFVLITAVLLYSVVKWRRKTPEQPAAANTTHNTTLEVVWTLVPLVIMMGLFAWGWKGSMDMTVAPTDCIQYDVSAARWQWSIRHPGTPADLPPAAEMWVPVDTNVKVKLHSTDVLHSFYIPAFRVKRDCLPGRYQMVWFRANKKGDFPLLCTEYCGKDHSYMNTIVHVVSQEEFDQRPWEVMPEDPVEYGELIYSALRGCKSCHSLDGSVITGPSFKGLWGKMENLADGSQVLVDREYVAESIRMPTAKIVKGFENVQMTAYPDITEPEIDAICAFLKTLANN